MSEKAGDTLFDTEKYKGAMRKYRAELIKSGIKPEDKARLHRKIGNCYRRQGKFHLSLDEYEMGLNVITGSDATPIIELERARLYYEKGVCYFYSNPMDLAKCFTERSLDLLKPFVGKFEPDIQSGLGDIYQFLAILDREQGEITQFIKNIDQAKRHFDLAFDEKKSLECDMNLNVEHLYSGNFQEPIAFFTKKRTKIQELIPNRTSFAYLNLALAYVDAGQLSLAKTNASNSLNAATEGQDPIGQQRAYEVLAEISTKETKQARSTNKTDEVQKYVSEVRELLGKGSSIAQNLQGSEFKEFEYNGKLIYAEVNIIVGNLDRADDMLIDALSFSDVNNLNLTLNSRAEVHRIEALLNTAHAERSTVAEEQHRYWKNAIRELKRAKIILKENHLNGKLIHVDIETAKVEILLNNDESALKTLDLALDIAQQYNRDNDVKSILEAIKPLLDKKQTGDEKVGNLNKINRLFVRHEDIKYEKISKDDVEQFLAFRVQLFDFLVERFSIEELKTLCFRLAINYEDLPSARSNMVRELILWTIRRNRLCELYCCAREERPDADWPIMPNCDCENKPSCKDRQQAPKP